VTPILPPFLREGAAKLIERVSSAGLARASAQLSESYRGGAGTERAIKDEADIASYLAARMPATYAAMAAALGTVQAQAPKFAPETLLDVGAGPGTASWAAMSSWPGLRGITMFDRHVALLSVAKTLCADSPHAALREARSVTGDIVALAGQYDVVLAGYAIAEVPAVSLAHALDVLWNVCAGLLVIVEPGTPQGFMRIMAARRRLLECGARIVAPCPGAYACPIVWPDWCHFSVRLPRSRAHLKAKGASVPFEDERFSYLAAARDTVPMSLPSARIVSEPGHAKPGVTLRLCGDGRIEERIIPRRDKLAHKQAAKLKWGDAFP
jgi:ribosomal protein RSM22 (predicted rRNA methylase)